MLVYILIGLFLVYSFFIVEFTRNPYIELILYLLSFLILFFVAGFRTDEVGSDSFSYTLIYQSFSYGGIFKPDITQFFTGRIEYGFLLTNQFLYSLSNSYVLLFVVFSLITLLIYFYIIKKMSANYFISLIIFFGYRLYTFSMSGIRASTSIAVCLLAFYFFQKQKKILSFITIILASSFHLSSLAFLLIFLIDKIDLTRKLKGALFFISILISLSPSNILNYALSYFTKYNSYVQNGEIVEANLATVLNFIIILIVFYFGEIFLKNKEHCNYQLLRKMMYVTLLISLIAIQVPMFGRFTSLFGSLIILYLPMVVEQIPDRNTRFLSKICIIGCFLAYFYIILIFRPEWNVLVPYKNILFSF